MFPAADLLHRLILGVLILGLAGCGKPELAESPLSQPATAAEAPRPVEVRLVDHDGLMRELERQRGKVTVLDCWSTSCPPCVKEFPGLVALAAKHGDRVACLSLAFDYDGIGTPEDLLPPFESFLKKIAAGQVVNMVSSEDADSLSRKLELTSVPAIFVWKPDGSLAIRYDDDMAAKELGRPFTYADVERIVSELLVE